MAEITQVYAPEAVPADNASEVQRSADISDGDACTLTPLKRVHEDGGDRLSLNCRLS